MPKANLQWAYLRGANLQGAVLSEANLWRALLDLANLQQTNAQMANLQGALLHRTNLQGAQLGWAKLQEAILVEANLQGAQLDGANLAGATLKQANLTRANLLHANLAGTSLRQANFAGADLTAAKLTGAIYEPNPESLPLLWTLIHPDSKLEELVFYHTPGALMALRDAFKKAGMRTQERQITYAIEHTKRRQAWGSCWDIDDRPWLMKLAGKIDGLFNYLLFELPSQYGLAPGRALWGLLGLIPVFALLYWIALQNANSRSGLWIIVPADRLTRGRGKEKIMRIRPPTAKTWRDRLINESRLFRTSLYFSLLSAFHLGWREFNVGTWIARMQPREYTLRATGWIRMVSGLQPLLSVYLLALWVLTYFGRPFE